jgi:hypothetical protein
MIAFRVAALLFAFVCCAASACERASFESLGMRRATMTNALEPRDSGATDATNDVGGSFAPPIDASIGAPMPAAGSGGSLPKVDVAGSGGTAPPTAIAGAAGSAGATSEFIGNFPPNTFEGVKASFVVGRSDEPGTTTAYLIDHPVTCAQISSFAWLVDLPADVQVIELMFPSSAMTGSPVTGSLVSYAHGGMYSFSKTIASMRRLVLSRNETGGEIEGTLQATFSSGSVSGTFHADFCATGMSF